MAKPCSRKTTASPGNLPANLPIRRPAMQIPDKHLRKLKGRHRMQERMHLRLHLPVTAIR